MAAQTAKRAPTAGQTKRMGHGQYPARGPRPSISPTPAPGNPERGRGLQRNGDARHGTDVGWGRRQPVCKDWTVRRAYRHGRVSGGGSVEARAEVAARAQGGGGGTRKDSWTATRRWRRRRSAARAQGASKGRVGSCVRGDGAACGGWRGVRGMARRAGRHLRAR
eukprot:2256759-Prymnesium_polylepis.1